MRIESVLLIGGIAIGWSLSSAISALRDYQYGWAVGFLIMVAAFGALLFRFVRRNV